MPSQQALFNPREQSPPAALQFGRRQVQIRALPAQPQTPNRHRLGLSGSQPSPGSKLPGAGVGRQVLTLRRSGRHDRPSQQSAVVSQVLSSTRQQRQRWNTRPGGQTVLRQAPPQSAVPAGQRQNPRRHSWSARQQKRPAQVRAVGQQTPTPMQLVPAGQQRPRQSRRPSGQAQAPSAQIWSARQAISHSPQLLRFVCRLTQRPSPQSVPPARHRHVPLLAQRAPLQQSASPAQAAPTRPQAAATGRRPSSGTRPPAAAARSRSVRRRVATPVARSFAMASNWRPSIVRSPTLSSPAAAGSAGANVRLHGTPLDHRGRGRDEPRGGRQPRVARAQPASVIATPVVLRRSVPGRVGRVDHDADRRGCLRRIRRERLASALEAAPDQAADPATPSRARRAATARAIAADLERRAGLAAPTAVRPVGLRIDAGVAAGNLPARAATDAGADATPGTADAASPAVVRIVGEVDAIPPAAEHAKLGVAGTAAGPAVVVVRPQVATPPVAVGATRTAAAGAVAPASSAGATIGIGDARSVDHAASPRSGAVPAEQRSQPTGHQAAHQAQRPPPGDVGAHQSPGQVIEAVPVHRILLDAASTPAPISDASFDRRALLDPFPIYRAPP